MLPADWRACIRERLMPPVVAKNPQSLKEWVGREIGVTEWFRVTQERIEQFAEATEDRQWIHVDRARTSNESPYGATIAHGFLTLSLIRRFLKEVIQIQSPARLTVNYGLNRVRFPAAVRADSRVRARIALLALKELDRKSTRLNSSHRCISYAVFCL